MVLAGDSSSVAPNVQLSVASQSTPVLKLVTVPPRSPGMPAAAAVAPSTVSCALRLTVQASATST